MSNNRYLWGYGWRTQRPYVKPIYLKLLLKSETLLTAFLFCIELINGMESALVGLGLGVGIGWLVWDFGLY